MLGSTYLRIKTSSNIKAILHIRIVNLVVNWYCIGLINKWYYVWINSAVAFYKEAKLHIAYAVPLNITATIGTVFDIAQILIQVFQIEYAQYLVIIVRDVILFCSRQVI